LRWHLAGVLQPLFQGHSMRRDSDRSDPNFS
jgi:hypothetical protein